MLIGGAVLACAGESSNYADSYAIMDSAGVEIVESFSPVWAEGTGRIDPEPQLRIGREEEGPYRFAFVRSGFLLEDGGIVVVEQAGQEVRIFDSAGRHRTTFGGAGEGPGEFRGLSGVFAYRGDSLAATDSRLRRTTLFSRSSGSHRTIPHQIEGNYAVFGPVEDNMFLLYSGWLRSSDGRSGTRVDRR